MKKKLYFWEEGLWHRCFDKRWRPDFYTKKEFKCRNCGFTNPYLSLLIPYLDRYHLTALKDTVLEQYDHLNGWYYSHRWLLDMNDFKKERILIK